MAAFMGAPALRRTIVLVTMLLLGAAAARGSGRMIRNKFNNQKRKHEIRISKSETISNKTQMIQKSVPAWLRFEFEN